MHSKRSYLDTVNDGRQRRAHSAIDDLNRTLEELGARLDRTAERTRPQPRAEERARPERDMRDDYHDEMLDRDMRHRMAATGRDLPGAATHDLARSIESTRRQEEGFASIGKIAGELKGLRDELRNQMKTGLHREFEVLRSDIERAYAGANAAGPDLGRKLERLSDSIQGMAGRGDDRSVELLRKEIDQVRATMSSLAREDTLQNFNRQWTDMDRRFDAFEQRLSARPTAADPAIEGLNARLEQIATAVTKLPESLGLRTLEEKVRTLAGAVDHFSRKHDASQPENLALIEERLDEISRAILASSVGTHAHAAQQEQFERVEARIASLARQIEEFADDRPTGQVIDRINVLSQRVDELGRRAELPERAITQLGDQIAIISERIEAGLARQDAEPIVVGLERQFSTLFDTLQRQQTESERRGQAVFRELETRLDELAAKLSLPAPSSSSDGAALMDVIDTRFDEMSQRFTTANNGTGLSMRKLEDRLVDISERLDRSSQQAPGIDPALIASLQSQVEGLSHHLSNPARPLPAGDDISPRLEKIERAIADNRDTVLEAARRAAEDAISRRAGAAEDPVVSALASDLKSLDQLARRSDARNSRTFEAIHDTLLKIVDRLGSLEQDGAGGNRPAMSKAELRATLPADGLPPLDTDYELTASVGDVAPPRQPKPTPAQAAAAAAMSALADPAMPEVEAEETAAAKQSMLGSLARALKVRRDTTKQPAAAAGPGIEPTMSMADLDDPIDPTLANRPLEPGSGAPDLNAIVKRVRDERGQPLKLNEVDAAKSDFIAAARRAAQAAAAEAETRKVSLDKVATATKSGIGGIFRNHRKAALMAVAGAVLILAGLQLGRAFLGDGTDVASTEPLPATAEPVQATISLPDTTAPSTTIAMDAPAPSLSNPMPIDIAAETPAAAAEPAVTAQADLPEETALPTPAETTTVAAAPETVAAPVVPAIPVEAGPVPLREAAEQGDPKAMFEIGSRYQEGRGVKTPDPKEAAKWYELAAEAGFAPAQYRIGNLYEKGIGVERDIAKAKTWYQMAAEQGNASAMHNLAVLFAMGADGATDNDSAGRWFTKAADLGVKDSQYNLGILAAKGVGVPQSLEDSYKWFALVAKAGDKDAASKRDEVANAMRPEQLERARAASELWKPGTIDAEANDVSVPESWTESEGKTASVDMKQAVRNIQLILTKNGYETGGADGVMGEKTKTAIAAFQKDNGLPASGLVDEALVQALLKKK